MTVRFNSKGATATPVGATNLVTAGVGAADDTLTSISQIFALFSSAFTVSSSGVATLATVGVTKGGTGLTTLTAHSIQVGAGTASPTQLALGTTAQVLHGNASGDPTWSAVSLTADVSGILPTANGGTGIAYFTAAGPTVARVYTFPDATCTILTTNATVTVGQGGTGLATLTAHAIYVGNGASAPTALSVGATNTLLHGNTGADPSFSAVVEADIALADNTTNDVGTTKHGFAPKAPGDATKFLNGANPPAWAVPAGGGGGMAIGGAVAGGAAAYVLFVDGSGNLGQSVQFQFVPGSSLLVSIVASAAIVSFTNNGYSAQFCAGPGSMTKYAGQFGDSLTGVLLCDGTYAVNVFTGSISVLGTTGNTYRWAAGVAAPTPQTLLSLPLSTFGAGAIGQVLGTPDAWVLVNIGGQDYKIPLYLPT